MGWCVVGWSDDYPACICFRDERRDNRLRAEPCLRQVSGTDLDFDYRPPTVVEDITTALGNTELAGVYDAIAETRSFEAVIAIVKRLKTSVPITSSLPYDSPTESFAPKFGEWFSQDISINRYTDGGMFSCRIPHF